MLENQKIRKGEGKATNIRITDDLNMKMKKRNSFFYRNSYNFIRINTKENGFFLFLFFLNLQFKKNVIYNKNFSIGRFDLCSILCFPSSLFLFAPFIFFAYLFN